MLLNKSIIHELFLYGYDEEQKVFFSPLDRHGHLEKTAIDYDILLDAFESAREYYRSEPVEKFYRAIRFFYPVMKMRLKPSYQESDTLINQAIMKIYAELSADLRLSFCYGTDLNERRETIHLGLDCLVGLKELITRTIAGADDKNFSIFMPSNFYKLYEHRKIMYDTFRLIQERLQIQDETFTRACNSYYGHIKTMQECYMLMKKIEINGNKEGFPRLSTKLDAVYNHDFQVLRDLFSIARDRFVQTL